MKQWYTLHTKPNSEYQVAAALQERGLETYLPESKISCLNRRNQQQPFFPCYLFTRINFETVELSQLQWTPGLRRLVAFGGQPVPVPDELIALMQRTLGHAETNEQWPTHNFKRGDTVRITEGPFQDMLAIFDGPTAPNERVHVLLNILGHASRVQVNVDDLKKTAPSETKPTSKRRRRTRGRGRRINYNS